MRAEEGSTASTGDLVAALDQEHAERVDGGGFADAGRAGDADADRLAGVGQQRLHQIARGGLMVAAPAFDQGDRARQRRAVARAEFFGEFPDIGGGILRQGHALGLQRPRQCRRGAPRSPFSAPTRRRAPRP